MWELGFQLLPEIAGLMVTPAAIMGSLVLLGSSRPARNLAIFGGTFLLAYATVSAVALSVGGALSARGTDPIGTRGWISLAVGLVLLSAGVISWRRRSHPETLQETPTAVQGTPQSVPVRRPQPVGGRGGVPDDAGSENPEVPAQPVGWLARLSDPTPRFLFTTALLLSLVNPNLAILGSGLGIILIAEVTRAQQALAMLILLAASAMDFIVPAVVYRFGGSRGRRQLTVMTGWLLQHDREIGAIVLLLFGLLFTGRGLWQLLY